MPHVRHLYCFHHFVPIRLEVMLNEWEQVHVRSTPAVPTRMANELAGGQRAYGTGVARPRHSGCASSKRPSNMLARQAASLNEQF